MYEGEGGRGRGDGINHIRNPITELNVDIIHPPSLVVLNFSAPDSDPLSLALTKFIIPFAIILYPTRKKYLIRLAYALRPPQSTCRITTP